MTNSLKSLFLLGIAMGFLSVAAGAFGAHALKQRLSPEKLAVFEIGARYQMYHALAICIAVWMATIIPGFLPQLAGWLFVGGIFIFSGSLYLLALTSIGLFGAFTPIGGVLFLLGWLTLGLSLFRL